MKVFVIAAQTIQGFVRDRVFYASLVFAFLIVVFSVFLSSLAPNDARKVLLDFGFAATSLVGVFFALFLGSTLVRKEIETRTIYTILAKPVGRGVYLWGKLLGAVVVVIGVHLVCAITLAAAVWVQGVPIPDGFTAALFLMILEAVLVLAISLFLSLGMSSLPLSASLAFAAFLIGRSGYGLFLLSQKASGAAKGLVLACYLLFPALQRFDIRDVVAYGKPYPSGMMASSSLYFLGYLVALMIASALVFERKDLS